MTFYESDATTDCGPMVSRVLGACRGLPVRLWALLRRWWIRRAIRAPAPAIMMLGRVF